MHVIYVDDEQPALDNFRWTVAKFTDIDTLNLFQNGEAALEWTRQHTVDVAFVDMEMPGLHGLGLAANLKEHNKNIRVVFVTAFSQYAMDAWGVDATGYVLKPYSRADIRKELDKCAFCPLPSKRIVIQTIPSLAISVNGQALRIAGGKPRELLALLVDRGEQGITSGEGIMCLWPDRTNDASTQSLFRMTYKRLAAVLEESGIGNILVSAANRRYLRVEEVDCDLYRILSGDTEAQKRYDGRYLQEYSWAEERNGQLYRMLIARE